MIPIGEISVGKHVCIVGYGTTSAVHEHTEISRITVTMIVTRNGRRFRRGRNQPSLPYYPYGGLSINNTCERNLS